MMKKRRQLARLPNVFLLFVQRCSRKRGPWNYSLTCRPVLTQLLVPKTTRENDEKSSALNTPTAFANPGMRTLSKSPPMLLGFILPHRQKWQTQKSPADGQSKYLNTKRKKSELTTSYIQRGKVVTFVYGSWIAETPRVVFSTVQNDKFSATVRTCSRVHRMQNL